MYKEIFATRLKETRIDIGLKQSDIASATGISREDVSRYENGTREPRIETLGKIAEYLDVSTDWLLGLGKKQK